MTKCDKIRPECVHSMKVECECPSGICMDREYHLLDACEQAADKINSRKSRRPRSELVRTK